MFKSWLISSNKSSRRLIRRPRARGSARAHHVMSRSNNGQRASSRPKANGGLGVENEYRHGAQSTSVVRRNQLWNTFSVVFVLHAGARVDVSVSRPVVSSFCSAIRHASLRRDVDLQARYYSLEPGALLRPRHRSSSMRTD